MKTKYGIVYDLSKSDYVTSWGYYKFYFSSATHLTKFITGMQAQIDWLNDSFSRRFHFSMKIDTLAVINFYRKIETRGFLVYNELDQEVYECPERVEFHGTLFRDLS